MKLKRVKGGEYIAENGLVIKRRDCAWYIFADGCPIHKCLKLTDARHIASYYTTRAMIDDAVQIRNALR